MWNSIRRYTATLATTISHSLYYPPRNVQSLIFSRSLLHTACSLALVSSTVFASRELSSCTDQPRLHNGVSLLGQEEAVELDKDLMQSPGFSLDQLMELAGLSVAAAFAEVFPLESHPCVLVVCGPGNNGGDGLVAARHLKHFGYSPVILFPKQSKHPHFVNLIHQCKELDIPIHESLGDALAEKTEYSAAIDAIFGFSFKGTPRAPFDDIIAYLRDSQRLPVLSVDIPSGWHVEDGDVSGLGFHPDALISLTAPKKSASLFQGRHFLGGRFVPPRIVEKYKLVLPQYPGSSQTVELTEWRNRPDDTFSATESRDEDYTVVWVTAPKDESTELAQKIISSRLAACVNIIPTSQSVYEWQGKTEVDDGEYLLMIKTRKALLKQLTEYVALEHSYDVPETIAAAIVGGNRQYLDWLDENTSPKQ